MTEPDRADAPLAPLTLEGWYQLNQFFRLDGAPYDDPEEKADDVRRLAELFRSWEKLGEDGWSGLYRIVGGGTDYMAVHFRPTLEALGEVERTVRKHDPAERLVLADDYLSVVELGLYSVTAALVEKADADGIQVHSDEWRELVEETLEQQKESGYVQRRLKPRQPDDMPYVCFYPMDKRRNPGQNWYTLSVEERARLMADHGKTGRRYAGKISQIISGSVGFDDWEWAVTLFAKDALDFKNLVTEMRYDEVSVLYAEFGRFWTGYRVPTGEIEKELLGAG